MPVQKKGLTLSKQERKDQHNSRYRLFGDRDETIDNMCNPIISEWSKLAQREYKTKLDWVGKGIHLELCKKFKFYHMNKWHVYNPESSLKNETH